MGRAAGRMIAFAGATVLLTFFSVGVWAQPEGDDGSGEEVSEHKIDRGDFVSCLSFLGVRGLKLGMVQRLSLKTMFVWSILDGNTSMVHKLLTCSHYYSRSSSGYGYDPIKKDDFDYYIDIANDFDLDDIERLLKLFRNRKW